MFACQRLANFPSGINGAATFYGSTFGPVASPQSDSDGNREESRFYASGNNLTKGPFRRFLGRLSHAPLLAQIGFMALLGVITGTPIIFGLGLGQGFIGADSRNSRLLGWCSLGLGLALSGGLLIALVVLR